MNELQLETKYIDLAGEIRYSGCFKEPKAVRTVAAHYKSYIEDYKGNIQFTDLTDIANEIESRIKAGKKQVLAEDIEIYVANKIWDIKFKNNNILNPEYRYLLITRELERRIEKSAYSAINRANKTVLALPPEQANLAKEIFTESFKELRGEVSEWIKNTAQILADGNSTGHLLGGSENV